MDRKTEIIQGTIRVFNRKGLKFTMDDVAKEISMSKKTIYMVYKDKEHLFIAIVEYFFSGIKEAEESVMKDNSLSTIEKLRAILSVMPESYKNIDFKQLYQLQDKYTQIFKMVKERIESGWDNTITLINKGIEEGVIRNIKVPIIKLMYESTLEQFFQSNVLIENGIAYQEALNEIVDIILVGIENK